MDPVLIIVLISVLGPVIGSLIGIIRKPSERFMFNMLSFAAGVMIAISFMQLIPEAISLSSVWIAIIGIVIGSLVMFGFDKIIPHIHPSMCQQEHGHSLEKTATYLLLGIFMHNFPEGMAIGIGSVSVMKLSLIVAIAIAIQNIPEGICTSAPYYYITKKRLRAFLLSSSTAIPILVGFAFTYYLFPNIPLELVGMMIGAVAGVMIYISADELIPISCCKMTNHHTIFSFMIGAILVVMLGLL